MKCFEIVTKNSFFGHNWDIFFTGYVMLQVENEMNDYNISGGSRGGAWEARPRRFILDKKLKKKELEKEEKPAGQSTKNRPSPPP